MSRANPRFKRTNPILPALTTPAYRVTTLYLCDQQVCLFTMDGIMASNTQTANSESNLATSWDTTMRAALKGMLSSDCFLTGYKVQCLTTPTRMPFNFAIPSISQAGGVAPSHIPLEMAVILSKGTAFKGQHGRGRAYFPGFPSSGLTPATDANRVNALGQTWLTAVGTALIAGTILDGANAFQPAVTQRTTKGAPTTNGAVITVFAFKLLLGTVRRRRIGRGK